MMRNYLPILFLFFSVNLFGQDEKPVKEGQIIVGGDFRAEYTSNIDYKMYDITTSPNIGYFLVDNMAIGLNIPLSYTKYNNLINLTSTSFGIGLFYKYYSDKGLFITVKGGFNFGNQKSGSGSDDTKISGFYISPGAGYAYFIHQRVSLEAGVFYEYHNTQYRGGSYSETNCYLLQIGFQIFL
jgi:outer membrane protein